MKERTKLQLDFVIPSKRLRCLPPAHASRLVPLHRHRAHVLVVASPSCTKNSAGKDGPAEARRTQDSYHAGHLMASGSRSPKATATDQFPFRRRYRICLQASTCYRTAASALVRRISAQLGHTALDAAPASLEASGPNSRIAASIRPVVPTDPVKAERIRCWN